MRIASMMRSGSAAIGLAAMLFAVPAFAQSQQQNGTTGCYSDKASEIAKYSGCGPGEAPAAQAQPAQQATAPGPYSGNKEAEDAAKYRGCGPGAATEALNQEQLAKALGASKGGHYTADEKANEAANYSGCGPNVAK
jgi:hypothetical protein